jgi:hypothetical protein
MPSNEEVCATLNQDQKPHNDEIMEDFTGGELFKSNPNLTKHSCL